MTGKWHLRVGKANPSRLAGERQVPTHGTRQDPPGARLVVPPSRHEHPQTARKPAGPWNKIENRLFSAHSLTFSKVRSADPCPSCGALAAFTLTERAEFIKDDPVQPGPDPVPAPLDEPPVDHGPDRAEHWPHSRHVAGSCSKAGWLTEKTNSPPGRRACTQALMAGFQSGMAGSTMLQTTSSYSPPRSGSRLRSPWT